MLKDEFNNFSIYAKSNPRVGLKLDNASSAMCHGLEKIRPFRRTLTLLAKNTAAPTYIHTLLIIRGYPKPKPNLE